MLLLGTAACRREKVESFEESIPPTATPQTPTAPKAAAPAPAGTLAWDCPAGWRESAATGMRLVSFSLGDGRESGLCTIVPLKGDAGGVRANVERWLQQAGIPMPAAGELDRFIAAAEQFRSRGDLPVLLLDLAGLRSGAPAPGADSIVAAVITLRENTLFVKMSGPHRLLQQEKERFRALCRSLRLENPT